MTRECHWLWLCRRLATAADLSHRYLWGSGVDHLLADEVVDGTPGQMTDVRWALTDHQGSVRDLVVFDDAGTAELGDDGVTLADHVVYDAFGNVASETSPALARLFGYTARPFDPATGLQNNLHRWYDPATGRWLSEDPIGLTPDANPYRYCGNSPANWIDPSGLESIVSEIPRDISFTTQYFLDSTRVDLSVDTMGLGSNVLDPVPIPFDVSVTTNLRPEDFYDPIHPDVTIWTPEIPIAWLPPYTAPSWDDGIFLTVRPFPIPPPIPSSPDIPPTPDWEWRPDGTTPGGPNGAWEGPFGDSLHPDFNHPGNKRPHWDWIDEWGNGWEHYPDTGTWKPKPGNKPNRPQPLFPPLPGAGNSLDDVSDPGGNGTTAVQFICVGGIGYCVYRIVRLIPSVAFPPLWPTAPANLACP